MTDSYGSTAEIFKSLLEGNTIINCDDVTAHIDEDGSVIFDNDKRKALNPTDMNKFVWTFDWKLYKKEEPKSLSYLEALQCNKLRIVWPFMSAISINDPEMTHSNMSVAQRSYNCDTEWLPEVLMLIKFAIDCGYPVYKID